MVVLGHYMCLGPATEDMKVLSGFHLDRMSISLRTGGRGNTEPNLLAAFRLYSFKQVMKLYPQSHSFSIRPPTSQTQ